MQFGSELLNFISSDSSTKRFIGVLMKQKEKWEKKEKTRDMQGNTVGFMKHWFGAEKAKSRS